MSVSAVNQYQIHDGERDAFLNAVRETFKLIESLGGKPQLRGTLYGGDLSGIQAAVVQFPNAVARGAYIDAITMPENVAKNSLVQLQRAGRVTLVGRAFLNETPATEAMVPTPQVLALSSFRIPSGRLADGEAALNEAKSLRQALGIESHTYTIANGGANSGLRLLTTHAASHKEAAENLARIQERSEGLGPIPRAVDEGSLLPVRQSVSTLVAL